MVTILTGKSGSGKDAMLNELSSEMGYERLVSATTRPMREGETDGKDYFFLTKEQFQECIDNGSVFEHRSYDTLVDGKPDTWSYGSLKQDLDPDKDYVAVVDMQGARDYVKAYGEENCFVVNITVDDKIREERAMKRGSFDKTEWDRRAADDAVKFSKENLDGIVNFKIDNTDSNIEDTAWAINEAKESYERADREADRHYVVLEETTGYSYEEPPESYFVTYDDADIKCFDMETSLAKNLAVYRPNEYHFVEAEAYPATPPEREAGELANFSLTLTKLDENGRLNLSDNEAVFTAVLNKDGSVTACEAEDTGNSRLTPADRNIITICIEEVIKDTAKEIYAKDFEKPEKSVSAEKPHDKNITADERNSISI